MSGTAFKDYNHQKNDPLMGYNHLTLMRWILAGAVAFRHMWYAAAETYPLQIHGWEAGYMAVNGFFILSGLLIAKSLHMRNNLKAYTVSRVLRIYPALIVLLLSFALIFAPYFSVPGGLRQITAPETWQYVFRVLLLGDPDGAPGGIFGITSETDFNGALWTIRFEIVAYFLAGLAYFSGAINSFGRTLSLFLIFQASYLFLPLFVNLDQLPLSFLPFLRLSSAFLMGILLWHWPRARNPSWLIVATFVVLFLIFGRSILGEFTANLALIGLLLKFGLPRNAKPYIVKVPDYSYGIYIWHYPVMQSILFILPGLGPVKLLFVSTPIFLLLAGMSWHFIEKPALRQKARFARPTNDQSMKAVSK